MVLMTQLYALLPAQSFNIMYIQYLAEIVLPSVQNVVDICKIIVLSLLCSFLVGNAS